MEVAPDVLVAPEVVVAFEVVVAGAGDAIGDPEHLVLHVRAVEPSALTVNLTWKPWLGCGVIPVRSRV